MTILLNGLERREFEKVYQALKIHPLWHMENIFHQKTFERSEFEKCGQVFYTRNPRPNRLSVATHEAAHALVLMATHQRVDSAEIDIENGGELLGIVRTGGECKDLSGGQLTEHKAGIPSKPLIVMDILVQSAGFIGESLVGRKTGAYHEKFLVFCQSCYLDDKDGLEPMTSWKHYIAWAKQIIKINEILFWRTADELLKNSKLSNEFINLLHSAIKKESVHKFFN